MIAFYRFDSNGMGVPTNLPRRKLPEKRTIDEGKFFVDEPQWPTSVCTNAAGIISKVHS